MFVVIKQPKLFDKLVIDDAFLDNFAREAAISHQVSHTHVVPFVGAVFNPPHLCLVYAYMGGGSVEQVLLKQQQFSSSRKDDIKQVFQMAVDAAQGLSNMHEQGVIHRDIATRNLLLDRQMRVW